MAIDTCKMHPCPVPGQCSGIQDCQAQKARKHISSHNYVTWEKTLSNVRAGLLVARGLTENRLPAACQVLTDLRMQCHLAFCGCGRGDKGEYGVEEISDWVRRVGSPFSRVVGNPRSRAGNCKASTSILAYCLYHLLIWVCVFQPFHSLHWMGRVY